MTPPDHEEKRVDHVEAGQRFEVRDATGPGWDWLPDWCVVDTEKQILPKRRPGRPR